MHTKHSTKILAMSLCFIAEGYFKCSLSYLRQEGGARENYKKISKRMHY